MTNTNTNAITTGNEIAMAKPAYDIQQNAQGKFERKAIYNDFSSVVAETKEEKIYMMNLLSGGEDDDNGAIRMRNAIGVEIDIDDVIIQSYDKLDEDTGNLVYGALTYLFSKEQDENGMRKVYVTSSKTVYHTLDRAFKIFGKPGTPEYTGLVVKVVSRKGQNHDLVDIKVIG